MKFNPVAAFFASQPSSVYVSKFPQQDRQFISKSLAKNKDFSQPYFIFQRVFSGRKEAERAARMRRGGSPTMFYPRVVR
jgi:hypothetical protein